MAASEKEFSESLAGKKLNGQSLLDYLQVHHVDIDALYKASVSGDNAKVGDLLSSVRAQNPLVDLTSAVVSSAAPDTGRSDTLDSSRGPVVTKSAARNQYNMFPQRSTTTSDSSRGPDPTAAKPKAADAKPAGQTASSYANYKSGGINPDGTTGGQADPFGSNATASAGLANPDKAIKTGTLGDLPGSFLVPQTGVAGTPITSSGQELINQLASMPADQLKALQQRLIDAGSKNVTANGVPDGPTIQAYTNVLNTAQFSQTNNPDHGLTPDEIIDSLIKANKTASKAKTVTEKSTSVDLTDPQTARATIESAMADKLGRKPTNQEIAQFTGALNAYEQSNPSVTNTTVQTDDTGLETSRNSTSTGGVSSAAAGAFAQNYITDNHGPEAQAVNHLRWWNVALNALGSAATNTGLPT